MKEKMLQIEKQKGIELVSFLNSNFISSSMPWQLNGGKYLLLIQLRDERYLGLRWEFYWKNDVLGRQQES